MSQEEKQTTRDQTLQLELLIYKVVSSIRQFLRAKEKSMHLAFVINEYLTINATVNKTQFVNHILSFLSRKFYSNLRAEYKPQITEA